MSSVDLITSEVCPFAQRSHLTLIEKGVDFQRIEVDLRAKPAWFEEVSPYSKVPVLRHGAVRIYESSIINEYVEEAFPSPALMPADAARRAHARIWIDFDNVKFVPSFYKVLLAPPGETRQRLAESIRDQLAFFDKEAFAEQGQGPYLMGSAPSLLDLGVYPHLERFAVLTEYRGIRIPPGCERLRAWIETMRERPSVRSTAHDDAFHVAAYARYADGTADGSTAKDMRM